MLRPAHTNSADERGDETDIARRCAEHVRNEWPKQPRMGIMLGSGLAGLAQLVKRDVSLPYSDLPSFPRPTAEGHHGELVCGHLSDLPVVALVGRSHLYEGYSAEQLTLPIRLLCELGASLLVLTNASGGLNPRFRRGDVMLIRDHLCLQFLSLGSEACGNRRESHSTQLGAGAYDDALAEWACQWARQNDIPLRQGNYVAVTGPNYETRAEYRMLRAIGGDAVGMSTALEAVTAARLGMRTLGLSMIANVANPDRPQRVTHEEVLAAGALAEPLMAKVVSALAERDKT